MKLLFLFTPFLFATLQGLTQSIDSVVAGLNNIARPILTTDPDYNFGDIEFLKTTLKGSAIIGLGESTHGTEVYTRYKQRLIRFLVSNMGVKTIIDEGDILAAEKVDDYINGRTDGLASVGNLRPAITKITELNWLRAYNRTQPDDQRVHIYGAEVRGYHDIIEKVLSTVPNIEDSDRKVLKRFTEDAGIGYSNFSEAEFKSLNNIITKLKTTHKELPGERYLNLLYQLNDFAYKDRFTKRGFKTRDNYMFENIKAIISKAQGRVIINAHNGHLQKTKFGALALWATC